MKVYCLHNLYPQVAVCVTAWLTVSVSMDRYISVCYPSMSKTLCTIPKARTVVTSLFVIMILLSIPSGFRYRLQTIQDAVNNETCMELVVTELGRNKEFMIPYTWTQNFLRGIIPVFILVFLNARIINVLRKERVKGKKFSSRNRITIMLIAMVVVFIVCITPDAIMSTFFGKGYVEEDFLVKGVREITDSLLAFNSAVNFLLYCTLSAAFRNTFMRVFFGRSYVKMRGGSCGQPSRDGLTTAAVRPRQQKNNSGAENSNKNGHSGSCSQLDKSNHVSEQDEEKTVGSEVTTNGYTKNSGNSKCVDTVIRVDQSLSKEKSMMDARLTCTVYTGPMEVIKHPWEVTVCVCDQNEPAGVQL